MQVLMVQQYAPDELHAPVSLPLHTVDAGRYGGKDEDKQEVEAEERHARGLLGPRQEEQEGRVWNDACGK